MSHTVFSRRQTLTRLGALALGSGLLLTGCSAEPKERKAFIAFLQTEVLGKSRRSMPLLNDKLRKELGGYAAHYEIITNFNQATNDKVMLKSMRELQFVRTLAGYRDKRESVKQALVEIPLAQANLEAELKKANEAKAALKQPEDLKKVYDPVYDRLVSAQARITLEMLPPMQRMMNIVLDLLALVENNPQQLSISGMQIEAKSQAMLDKVNALSKKAEAETATIERLEKELKQLFG
ncbi:hypothetical protein ASF11_06160 [Acidovorax sp. Leaf76]|uniref:DUF3053 family protein n=1 Tax=unclassified Acidovorax TaxID=2684926 RepID=UPI0006F3103B|nr:MULTISPECIES: DUF3053 family protein [unclassified Acidovorax]KQO21985.1 hypothetical protein ASF11_06160 [Acidovorax sp. Leaf76]KQO35055.1 hypothetical protein ASF19_05035 [Acidovorax sp. Leaf84]KQS34839.1 hypothetical protein ASG27_05275 [Acidovorax sp. Leaf191]